MRLFKHAFARIRTVLAALALGSLALASQAQVPKFIYYHNDLAGTPMAATDDAGNVLWRQGYKPYGERLDPKAPAEQLPWYTGKAHVEAAGLSYYGARWYDPALGRFMGVDPVGFSEANVHSFNRYAYANNNPYKFVDPDGRSPLLLLGRFFGGGAFGAGLGTIADAISQKAAFGSVDWAMAAQSSAARDGAIAGAMSFLPGDTPMGLGTKTLDQGAARAAASGAESATSGLNLSKALASQAQMGETGIALAGDAARVGFRDGQRVAAEHGGQASDWVKKSSSTFKAKDGTKFETHWTENVSTDQRVEFKTKFPGE